MPDDVPAQPPTAASLNDQDRLLRAILEGTTDAIFVKDREGRYLIINAAGARYIGRSVPEIIGRRDGDVFPAEVAARIVAHDRQVIETGTPHAYEAILPVEGQPRVFLSTKTPYRDGSGRIVGLIGISRDITERKQAEEKLRESEERFARILESALDAIVTVDAQGRIRLFNAAAEDMFRCPAAEAIGQPFQRFATKALQNLLTRCQLAFGQSRVKKRYVWVPAGFSALRACGELFPIEATISQVQSAGEQLLTIILRDVNERQQAQQELRKLRLAKLYFHEEEEASLGAGEMVGESPAMQKVLRLVEQVARTDSTVLVTGETGTGKELVARAIHRGSARKDAMLVKVNCAALPAGLIESELFGHEKGAFTGAISRKVGRFEMAEGGTIFLDEIADLPLELQAKLLRVLQEGEFERVGGAETLRVNVRVIAATNRDLERALGEQRFREDLFYRLNVFPIRVPPLRERAEDTALLARHFALRHSRALGKRIDAIPPAVIAALRSYRWPGNVRELQNVIERAVILSPGPTLELGEWPPTGARLDASGPGGPAPPDADVTLADLERQHILRVLERTNWRVSGPKGAAAVLGLKPTTLESRMKKLGIARG